MECTPSLLILRSESPIVLGAPVDDVLASNNRPRFVAVSVDVSRCQRVRDAVLRRIFHKTTIRAAVNPILALDVAIANSFAVRDRVLALLEIARVEISPQAFDLCSFEVHQLPRGAMLYSLSFIHVEPGCGANACAI